MKSKIFSLISLSILSLVLLVSFASALTLTSSTSTLSRDGGSFTLSIADATAGATISFSSVKVTDADGTDFILPAINQLVLVSAATSGITPSITYTTTNFDFDFEKEYTITVTAIESPTLNATTTLTFAENTDFYDGNNNGSLKVKEIEVDVTEGFGEDKEFYPFDEVEVTFNVDNQGSWDIEDIEIQVCLLDEKTDDCILDEDDMDIDNDKFDLDNGDDQDVKINFQIDAKDLNEENTDYTLYIKAVGNIDDNDAEDDNVDGDTTGDSDYEKDLELITDDFAILNDFEINGMSLVDSELKDAVACASELQLFADVWNIGDDDLEDVSVRIYNSELGISKVIEIDEINAFDSEILETTLNIPENAESKYYTLEFTIYEDNDVFETSNDDKALFKVLIKVDGNCEVAKDSTKIVAALTSEAKSGNDLTVKTTITNSGSKTANYILNVADYSSWATLEDFEKSLTLVAGESRDVTLTFNVNKDAEGNKNFNIEVISGDVVTKQPVSVTIEAQKSLLGFNLPENNLYLWGIGALNVLLILSIIFVAIRLSRN